MEELITAMEDSRKAIKDMQAELRRNKDEVADSVARRVKRSLPLEFRRKGNEKQYKFNEELVEKLEEAATELQSVGDVPEGAEGVNVPRGVLEKAKESIKQGTVLVQERQKCIRMADRSEYGWDVVQEYQSDELAANSEDEKRISKAEKAAEQRSQRKKKSAAAKGGARGLSQARSDWWRNRAVPFMPLQGGVAQAPGQWQFGGSRPFGAPTAGPMMKSGRVQGPCFACGEFGHLRSSCPRMAPPSASTSKYPHCNELCMNDGLCGECSPEMGEGSEPMLESRYWENSGQGTVSVKGRLRSRVEYWRGVLGASEFVCGIISEGYRLPFVYLPESKVFNNHSSTGLYSDFVSIAVDSLYEGGCVRKVAVQPRVCSPLLVVTSRSGKQRLVVNLRYINRFLWKDKFKYEDIHTAMAYFEKDSFVNTFDLKSGYHHVDIHEDFQSYLGFRWDGQYYVFSVLPFGLATACYIFTKVLRPVVKFWRSKGIKAVLYIDDGVIISHDVQDALENISIIQGSLSEAGFVVNEEKSCWELSQVGRWLGFVIDLSKGVLEIPREKTQDLVSLLERAQRENRIKPKLLASIVGKIIAMGLGLGPITRLRTRSLYALLNRRVCWYEEVKIDHSAREELEFLATNIEVYNGQKIWHAPSAVRVVFSDASNTGYGGYTVEHGCHIAQGQWDKGEDSKSSTWRELAAVLRVLRAFAVQLASNRVKWFSDNQNVVRIIKVGSKVRELQILAVEIFRLAMANQIILEPEWIPRADNELADYVSRIVDYDDWRLHPEVFRTLDLKWGPHTVDRFANAVNAQLPRFNSRFWVVGTEAVDAFTVNWQGDNNWLCPPVYLIPRVLRHAQKCACVGTLVVPFWKSAVFWPFVCYGGEKFYDFVKDWVLLGPNVEVLVLPGLAGSQLPVGTALLALRFDLRGGPCRPL